MDLFLRFILSNKKKVPSVMLYAVNCTYGIQSLQSVSLGWPSLTFLCLQHSERRRPLLSLPVRIAQDSASVRMERKPRDFFFPVIQ